MVDAVEDVLETEAHEGPGGAVPAGVELEPAMAAVHLVGAPRTVGRQEVDEQLGPVRERRSGQHVEREAGVLGGDRVFQMEIEIPLVPEHVGGLGERRSGDVRRRLLVRAEGVFGRLRDPACRGDGHERRAVLVQHQFPSGGRSGSVQTVIEMRKVEIAGPPLGQTDVQQHRERNPDQEMQPLARRLDEGAQDDLVRNVVGSGGSRQQQSADRNRQHDRGDVAQQPRTAERHAQLPNRFSRRPPGVQVPQERPSPGRRPPGGTGVDCDRRRGGVRLGDHRRGAGQFSRCSPAARCRERTSAPAYRCRPRRYRCCLPSWSPGCGPSGTDRHCGRRYRSSRSP